MIVRLTKGIEASLLDGKQMAKKFKMQIKFAKFRKNGKNRP